MDILWKGLVGGGLTAIIALLAKKGNILPGILPLFPTFALIALYIIGLKQDPQAFKQASSATLKTIPAYFVFLMICYFIIDKFDFKITLTLALLGWFLAAFIIFLGPKIL